MEQLLLYAKKSFFNNQLHLLYAQRNASIAGQQIEMFTKSQDIIQTMDRERHDFNAAPKNLSIEELNKITQTKMQEIMAFFS